MNTSKQHTKHIKTRRIVAIILVVAMAIVIFSLSHVPGTSYPSHPGFLNYVAHFSEYMVFAALLTIALTGGKLKTWQVILIALLLASAYAVSDELHQYFVPARMCDPMDWLTDTAGAAVGAVITSLVLKKIDAKHTA